MKVLDELEAAAKEAASLGPWQVFAVNPATILLMIQALRAAEGMRAGVDGDRAYAHRAAAAYDEALAELEAGS